MPTDTDRIEKQVLLRAPRERVWRALTNADEFSQWFGMKMKGEFVPGARVEAELGGEYAGLAFSIVIEQMEELQLFSWHWHPGAIEPGADYAAEPMTLVVFTLEERPEGTLLTVVESGFDQVPASRRARAFEMNTEGWEAQLQNIEQYVEGA